MDIKACVRNFVYSNFAVDPSLADIDNIPLLESGVMDSTGVIELVMFVSQEFKIPIPPDDIVPENFNSITQLATYILHRTKSGVYR